MSLLKSISLLMRETVHEWIEDGGANIAAALAYYAIFSLSPLLIIVSITLGLVMDPNTLETNLVSNVQATVGQQAAELIRSLMRSSGRTTDVIGTLVWLGIVVWGASGMFAQLQNALNKIWEVKARPGRSPLVLVKSRFQSFGIVVITALALLGTMLINAALNSSIDNSSAALAEMKTVGSVLQVSRLFGLDSITGGHLILLRTFQVLVSVSVTTGLIAVVYQVLPDVEISWRDVIVGSLFTGVLLFIGQFLVGLYLARANIGSVFGAAGSLTVILVWVYYSAQILLFGAEFTEVWARHYGTSLRPDGDAVWANEAKAREEARKAGVDWAEIEARQR
jgi:membrane protein